MLQFVLLKRSLYAHLLGHVLLQSFSCSHRNSLSLITLPYPRDQWFRWRKIMRKRNTYLLSKSEQITGPFMQCLCELMSSCSDAALVLISSFSPSLPQDDGKSGPGVAHCVCVIGLNQHTDRIIRIHYIVYLHVTTTFLHLYLSQKVI